MRTIVQNLISNSIRFADTAKSSSIIEVQIDENEEALSLIVRDNGVGISRHVQPYVLDMFFRGSEQSDGAGLGLYITRKIVSKLNGDLSIKSVEGDGTMVTVRLPDLHKKMVASA